MAYSVYDLLVNLFNTELAMHYRMIFKYSYCFVSGDRDTLLPWFGPDFSR